jgi:hypothetical protein
VFGTFYIVKEECLPPAPGKTRHSTWYVVPVFVKAVRQGLNLSGFAVSGD